jgi:hypothetical protein
MLLGVFLVATFHLMEKTESIWKRAFVDRLSVLERRLRSARKQDSPGIVRSIGVARKRASGWNWVAVRSEFIFYFALYAVAAAAIVLSALFQPVRNEKQPSTGKPACAAEVHEVQVQDEGGAQDRGDSGEDKGR